MNASSTPELPTLAPPGPLAPGIHLSDQFAVAFTYTIGEGWIVSEDDPDYFALSRVATPDGEIELSYDVYPPGSVPALFNHSVPHAGADVIDGIRAEPCFATLVSPTSVGGLTGSALTVTVGADAACEDRSLYVIRWSDGMPMTIAVGPGGTYDLDVLDDGAGHALVLEITGDAAFRALSSTVIDTFRFQLPAS